MNRPEFLTSPGSWIRTRRITQTAAEYASSLERPQRRDITAAFAGWIVAVAVGLLLALLLIHYLTPCEAGALCIAPFAQCRTDACNQGRSPCPTPEECAADDNGQLERFFLLVTAGAAAILFGAVSFFVWFA